MKFTKAVVIVRPMYSYRGEWADKNIVSTPEGVKKDLHYEDAQDMVDNLEALPRYQLEPLAGYMPAGNNILFADQLAEALGLPRPFKSNKDSGKKEINMDFLHALESMDEVFISIKQGDDREGADGKTYPTFKFRKLNESGLFAKEAERIAELDAGLVQPKLKGTPIAATDEDESEEPAEDLNKASKKSKAKAKTEEPHI